LLGYEETIFDKVVFLKPWQLVAETTYKY
jgi:hypothetical protein